MLQYFDDIFSSTQLDGALMGDVINTIEPRVSAKANQRLTLPFTAKEVTDALSCMYSLKSPDPDGFPALFYTRFGKVVRPNVVISVLKFLNSKTLPQPLNFTFIVLIPKHKNPSKMTEFCPISLCNVIYKLGSKVIANRLEFVLPSMMSPIQSAFVPNCLINDNVLLAFELNHFIKSKPNSKDDFMTLKLDVGKAYDR